jgi:hypothetical protein
LPLAPVDHPPDNDLIRLSKGTIAAKKRLTRPDKAVCRTRNTPECKHIAIGIPTRDAHLTTSVRRVCDGSRRKILQPKLWRCPENHSGSKNEIKKFAFKDAQTGIKPASNATRVFTR